ncbi:MAG: hypothetical protein JJ939_05410 [Alphaproteobacteria bacterium]|nr:hypothetical protein [Alphaproteobacteria bacterium]MBO6627843.1 hypothetical protein [Alphaproteobacteria bacterium]MDF1625412.1 hypothetical protein [Parvibaculaceae bacterium]|tara:strand:- start:209 stop:490 length:282 start_codon:yes stop_codon:yes gene_type:complete
MSNVSKSDRARPDVERKREQRKKERRAKLMIWIARRSSRNRSFIDRLCRRLIEKASTRPPEKDFMRDELIDNDLGFDPDELDRYQRGEQARAS